jgi:hypothetical protein
MECILCDFVHNDLAVYLLQTNQLLRGYTLRAIRPSFPLNFAKCNTHGKVQGLRSLECDAASLTTWILTFRDELETSGTQMPSDDTSRTLEKKPLRPLETSKPSTQSRTVTSPKNRQLDL